MPLRTLLLVLVLALTALFAAVNWGAFRRRPRSG